MVQHLEEIVGAGPILKQCIGYSFLIWLQVVVSYEVLFAPVQHAAELLQDSVLNPFVKRGHAACEKGCLLQGLEGFK